MRLRDSLFIFICEKMDFKGNLPFILFSINEQRYLLIYFKHIHKVSKESIRGKLGYDISATS